MSESPPPASIQPSIPPPGEPWTPILLARWSGEYLRGKGVLQGRLEAELLLAHVLGVGRLELYLQYDRPLAEKELGAFKVLLKRRARREPLQYILGRAAFRELVLRVDRRALVPRPETELLVGEVLAWAQEVRRAENEGSQEGAGEAGASGGLSALDLGTGSGAIALSLLAEGPFSRVVATDVSSSALDLARENAEALGLEHRLDLRLGSLFEPLGAEEHFHVLVSNPPYVPLGDFHGLQREVRDWEPPEALLGGQDGLDVIRAIVTGAPAHLFPGGLLALEVGDGQASQVAALLRDRGGFRTIGIRKDLAGKERVVLGVAAGDEMKDL